MTQPPKRRGGVIVAPEHHTYGLIALLATPIRDQLDLAFYPHAYEIDAELPHDFIIVLSLDDLRSVIKFFDAKRLDLPLMVHIDHPDTVAKTRYEVLFPGIKIHPVAQAGLDTEPGVTLELNNFAQIVGLLKNMTGEYDALTDADTETGPES